MGRGPSHGRTNLSDDLQERICRCLRLGMRFSDACRANRVSVRTGNDWLQIGRGDHPTRRPTARYTAFVQAVEKAEADAVEVLVQRWMEASATDWRAARDLLARRFPDEWGPVQRLAGADGGPLVIEVREVDWVEARAEGDDGGDE